MSNDSEVEESSRSGDSAALAAELRRLALEKKTDVARLAQMALAVEDMAVRERRDAYLLFQDAEQAAPSELEALRRSVRFIATLGAAEFFSQAILLLLLEARRQRRFPVDRQSSQGADLILQALAAYPLGEQFSTGPFLAEELVAWVLLEVSATWPRIDATSLVQGIWPQSLLECCRKLLRAEPSFCLQGVLWERLESWIRKGRRDEGALLSSIALVAEAGDIVRAESLIAILAEPYDRARATADLASALFACGRDEEALARVSSSSENRPILEGVLGKEVDRRITLGSLSSARWIAASIAETGLRARCLADVALAWLRQGEAHEAYECLEAAVAAAKELGTPRPLFETLEALSFRRLGKVENADDFDGLLEDLWNLPGEGVGELKQFRRAVVGAWATLGMTEKALRNVEALDDFARVECKAAIALEVSRDFGSTGAVSSTLDQALSEARGIIWPTFRCPAIFAVAHSMAGVGAKRTAGTFYEALAAAREVMADRDSRAVAQVLGNFLACLAAAAKFEDRLGVFREALEVASEMSEDAVKFIVVEKATVLFSVLGEETEARIWLEKFYQVTELFGDSRDRSGPLEEMARALLRRGWFEEARLCLSRMEPDASIKSQVRLAEEIFSRHPAEALSLLETAVAHLPKIRPVDRESLAVQTAKTLMRCGLAEKALQLAASMESSNRRSTTLSEVALEGLHQDNFAVARNALMLIRMEPSEPKVVVELAFEPGALLALARDLASRDPRGRLRYELFLSAFGRAKKMVAQERFPDAFEIWLKVISEAPRFEGREKLLRVAALTILELRNTRSRDDLIVALALAHLKMGDVERSAQLAEALADRPQYARLMATIALEEARQGAQDSAALKLVLALEALDRVEPRLKEPFQSDLLPAICTLPDEKEREDLLQRAISQLCRMEPDTERAYALAAFGNKLAESTQELWAAWHLSGLIRAIEEAEMGRLAFDLEVHRIALLARAGDIDEALANARLIDPNLWHHPGALVRIVGELIEQESPEAAIKVYRLIEPASSRVEALNLMVCCPHSRLQAEFRDFLFESLQEQEDIEARSKLVTTWLESLIAKEIAVDMPAMVKELSEIERRIRQVKSDYGRSRTLANLVKARALLGQVDRAVEVLEELDAGELATDAISVVAEAVASRQELSSSQRIFSVLRSLIGTFEDPWFQIAELAKLVKAMARSGLRAQAADLLAETVCLCEKLRPVRSQSIVDLASAFQKPKTECGSLVLRLLVLTSELDSESSQIEALVAIARTRPRIEEIRPAFVKMSGRAWQFFLRALRESLLASEEAPVGEISASLGFFAREPGAGFAAASFLAAALLRQGETASYDALVGVCPSLGLPRLS